MSEEQNLILWKPSVYIHGRGVVYLTLDEVRDVCATRRGAPPQTEVAQQFFSAANHNPS